MVEVSSPICGLLSIYCCTAVLYWCAGVHAKKVVVGSYLFSRCLLAFLICPFTFCYFGCDFYYFLFHYFQDSFGLLRVFYFHTLWCGCRYGEVSSVFDGSEFSFNYEDGVLFLKLLHDVSDVGPQHFASIGSLFLGDL